MKKTLIIISFLLSSQSFAQPGGITLTKEQKEIKSLEREFFALISPDTFHILHLEGYITAILKDSVLPMGLISAPYYTDSAIINNPWFADLWTRYVIEFRMETKKNEKEKKQVQHFNDSIQQLIDVLPMKLGIEHLQGDKEMYTWKIKKDLKKIQEYEEEKRRLYYQLLYIPRFSTQYLDIYIMDDDVFDGYTQHPEWDGYYLVPNWANALRWRIWDGVKAIQKKYEK